MTNVGWWQILGGLFLASFMFGTCDGAIDKCTMGTWCNMTFSTAPQTATFVVKANRARLNRGEVRLFFKVKGKPV